MKFNARSILVALTTTTLTLVAVAPASASDAPSPTASHQPSVHRVPTVPFSIDGNQVAPEAILAYQGRTLHSALIAGDGDGPDELFVFTRPDEFEKFVRAQGGPDHALAKPTKANGSVTHDSVVTQAVTPQTYPVTGAAFYEHMGMYGAGFWLNSGQYFQDLTKVSECWLFCPSFNDRISSLWTGTGGGAVLYEHINFGGSVLWVGRGVSQPYLEGIGWNDRASAVVAW
jgi:hypothetical protein